MVYAPDASLNGYVDYLKTNPEQRPQAIANAVVELLEMPHGKKPFRTVVDFLGLKNLLKIIIKYFTRPQKGFMQLMAWIIY